MRRERSAMKSLSRSAARRAAYVVPANRRDWAEAVWAEAYEVPPGLRRLTWRAGGVWLIARESLMTRRVRNSLLLAVAAAYLAWMALPGTPSGLINAFIWLRIIGTIVVLAGLPWLVRRRLGPVIDVRLARWLRVATFAGIIVLLAAMAELDHITDTASKLAAAGPHNQPSIGLLMPWSTFLVLLAGYVAVILAVTSQRSSVTPRTLAIGTSTGIALGVVMYAIMPLGLDKYATAPWLSGSAMDPVVVLAWTLLCAGPLAAALLAGWRCRTAVGPLSWGEARVRQGVAAGIVVTLVGSLVVCVLGTATLAGVTWYAHLLYSGHHLTGAAAAASRASTPPASGAAGYFLVWLLFPIVGLVIACLTALGAWGNQSVRERGAGPGDGGPGGPEPAPEGPSAGWSADVEHEPASVAAGLYVSTHGF